jgi:hypothetical protein
VELHDGNPAEEAGPDVGIRGRSATRGARAGLVLAGVGLFILSGLSALMLWSGMVRAGYVLAGLALVALASCALLWWRQR